MQLPLEIACPDFSLTESIRTLIDKRVDDLDRMCDHITSSRITIEMPQKHQDSGSAFRVRVEVHIPPGHDLVAKQKVSQGEIHDTLPFILHESFDAIEKQVSKVNAIQHGTVKSHPNQQIMGFVSKLFPDQGYGFIESLEGEDIYFHRNSVIHNDFDRLTVGCGVRYVEESGEKGTQASTVKLVDKPGVRVANPKNHGSA